MGIVSDGITQAGTLHDRAATAHCVLADSAHAIAADGPQRGPLRNVVAERQPSVLRAQTLHTCSAQPTTTSLICITGDNSV